MFIHHYNSNTNHQYMEDWLIALSQVDYGKYFTLANKDLTDDEIEFLSEASLDVYCQEMDIKELQYDAKFLRDNLSLFMANIIIYSLKCKDLVKIDGPISLYKDYVLERSQKLIELYA